MASFDIEQLRALPDVAQVTRWDIQFITLPAIGPFGFPAIEGLNLRAESVNIPSANNETFVLNLRGHELEVSGLIKYNRELTITFIETVDNYIMKLCKAWRELCGESRQQRAFSQSDLEAVINIVEYDNQDKIRNKRTYYGCFWKTDNFGDRDGATSDAIKPQLTLAYQYFIDAPLR